MKTGTVYEQARTGLETIFVAVGPADRDRNERLAEEAIDLAGPSGAGVVLGHVFTEEEYVERRDALGFDPDSEVTPDRVAERIAAVRDLGEALDAADVEYEVRGALGDSGEGIVDLADAADADLVLVGGRTRSPTGKAVFGSTAQEVMLSASSPVLFVRADSQ
jgi:nucleotide-binding universal stress UspA family protein